ncbi:AAA family ATPase [Delftia acidovorans]|uniref:AAA family ATPase n=1 Tax=Delftia acidovorans TaxID=80866 RepID=UPI000F83FD5E|nr:AAA family ATPase [Delftia acidovorans]
MQQFNQQQLKRLTLEAAPNKMVFLIGENGSGKSRSLAKLSVQLTEIGHRVLAIANTPFTRFLPESFFGTPRYKLHLAGATRTNPSHHIKQLLINSASRKKDINTEYGISGVVRIMDYLGISTKIGFSVEPRKDRRALVNERLMQPFNANIDNSAFRKYHDAVANALNRLHEKDDKPYLLAGRKYLESVLLKPGEIEWIDLRMFMHDYRAEILRSLLYSEKEVTPLLDVNIYISKRSGEKVFPIDSISSGESSLFTTLNFINQNISRNTWILIDEPENSLHPRWQKEYCKNMVDFFHYLAPVFVISTHSPMIVSGASGAGLADLIYSPGSFEPHKINDSEGVESLLMDVFETITSKNHYFSEKAQILLDDFANGKRTLQDTLNQIEEWRHMISDSNQSKFLDELNKLALKINNN